MICNPLTQGPLLDNPFSKSPFAQCFGAKEIIAQSPVQAGAVFAFATSRMAGVDDAVPILRVERAVAADEVDIWDVNPGTLQYKLTSSGSWIDGAGETFTVTRLYNQVHGTFAVAPAPTNRATLLLNQQNGYPAVVFVQASQHAYDVAYTATPAAGTMMAGITTAGTIPNYAGIIIVRKASSNPYRAANLQYGTVQNLASLTTAYTKTASAPTPSTDYAIQSSTTSGGTTVIVNASETVTSNTLLLWDGALANGIRIGGFYGDSLSLSFGGHMYFAAVFESELVGSSVMGTMNEKYALY